MAFGVEKLRLCNYYIFSDAKERSTRSEVGFKDSFEEYILCKLNMGFSRREWTTFYSERFRIGENFKGKSN
ncbi:hypothetical protein Tthe_0945 [Thermoanaerobacterium thermosaccharolyticum DSM 571]|uniref:Uncharacterized protein n=1 Tax=Thermoanaerobacterium thermosaccharolyticum (strain ATCC 7956 / DSM 571 / NCIMB 9385 / NCA 3814 / NCTC 13789 / WDCM 00135 / 2032) TaxID=580327 RepID=D9TMJ1_THETC|nr:hypothetical protein Tthe_0945 [Thermoanaerobacterium thermosaccharolyticum DSM 571]MCP2239480.1 hypothetical protein [Thermoanaerobacterium thermosaccharolyticum]